MIPRTNHVLHIVLSILTGGLWLPFYALAAHRTAKRRRWVDAGRMSERYDTVTRHAAPPSPSMDSRP